MSEIDARETGDAQPPGEPFRLTIPSAVLDAAIAHARAELPNESCGFFAGRVENGIGNVVRYLPLVNERQSPTAFATEPRSLFEAYRRLREFDEAVVSVVHSHPTSPPVPSRYDLDENTYGPNIPWVIVGLAGSEPAVRTWWLNESGFRKATVQSEPERQ